LGEEVKAIIRNTGRAGARRAHAREGVQKLFFDDRNTNDCRQPNKAEKERNGGGKQVEQERKEGER
jgi:hypothetical protein